MDEKLTNKDKRPDSSRLISSFEDAHPTEGTFPVESTVPGQYSSLSDVTDHGHMPDFDTNSFGGLADLIDPSLDGGTIETELAESTQTDMVAVTDGHDHDAHEQVRALLLDCVATLDDLDRAIAVAREHQAAAPIVEELAEAHGRFLERLAGYGIEPEGAVGESFDPEVHEVVGEAAGSADAVVEVERVGYTRHGHALRRARVILGKKTP